MVDLGAGVVAFLDALGTKGVWQRERPTAVIERWHRMCDDIVSADALLRAGLSSAPVDWVLQGFSDTLILSCVPTEATSELDLLAEISQLTMRLVAGGLRNGIRLRGAIAWGELHRGRNIIIGPAVDEAAQHYEAANWIGVHLAPSAAASVQALASEDQRTFGTWAPWEVPYKAGPASSFGVGWPLVFDLPNWSSEGTFSSVARARFTERLADMRTGENSVAEKYRNTIAYYDAYAAWYADREGSDG